MRPDSCSNMDTRVIYDDYCGVNKYIHIETLIIIYIPYMTKSRVKEPSFMPCFDKMILPALPFGVFCRGFLNKIRTLADPVDNLSDKYLY